MTSHKPRRFLPNAGFVIITLGLFVAPGCSMHDLLFSVLGDSYSGGGVTREEKKYDYQQRLSSLNDGIQ